jgi:hypothetical protein
MFEGMSRRKALRKMWSKQEGEYNLCGNQINRATRQVARGYTLLVKTKRKENGYTPNVTEDFIYAVKQHRFRRGSIDTSNCLRQCSENCNLCSWGGELR